MSSAEQHGGVLAFWREAGPRYWYVKDDAFDQDIRARFAAIHARAAAGDLDAWGSTSDGALALLILLDQFSRNMFRGTPEAFAQDGKARGIARDAIDSGFDRQAEPAFRQFFYTPFMHSETLADQGLSVRLCHGLPDPGTLPYAIDHERIVRRFGRFPHRNGILGRHTSPAEQAFLEGGGFSG